MATSRGFWIQCCGGELGNRSWMTTSRSARLPFALRLLFFWQIFDRRILASRMVVHKRLAFSDTDDRLELPDPNVAVLHRVAMVLQVDRRFAMFFVMRHLGERRNAFQSEVVERENAVVQYGDVGR